MNKYSDKFLTSDYTYHTVYAEVPYPLGVPGRYSISCGNGGLPSSRSIAAASPAKALIRFVESHTDPDAQDGKTFFVRYIPTGAVWQLKARVTKPTKRHVTTTAA